MSPFVFSIFAVVCLLLICGYSSRKTENDRVNTVGKKKLLVKGPKRKKTKNQGCSYCTEHKSPPFLIHIYMSIYLFIYLSIYLFYKQAWQHFLEKYLFPRNVSETPYSRYPLVAGLFPHQLSS